MINHGRYRTADAGSNAVGRSITTIKHRFPLSVLELLDHTSFSEPEAPNAKGAAPKLLSRPSIAVFAGAS